jgi:chemosensory pili system protein ChpA (sensor histidine kinase/response regulator)
MAKKIMIVEDEKDFQDMYTAFFEDKDYEIVFEYDGNEALEKLAQIKPDLIITDIQMSVVTGDTFFLYLKDMPEYAGIPVIVISSCSQRDYKNLKEIDPNLVYIEKQYLDKKKLLDEVDKKLVVPKLSDLCSRIL